jgi:hypothetical protein
MAQDCGCSLGRCAYSHSGTALNRFEGELAPAPVASVYGLATPFTRSAGAASRGQRGGRGGGDSSCAESVRRCVKREVPASAPGDGTAEGVSRFGKQCSEVLRRGRGRGGSGHRQSPIRNSPAMPISLAGVAFKLTCLHGGSFHGRSCGANRRPGECK